MSACCLYGGTGYNRQPAQLERGADIVVATPGRIKVFFPYCLLAVFGTGGAVGMSLGLRLLFVLLH